MFRVRFKDYRLLARLSFLQQQHLIIDTCLLHIRHQDHHHRRSGLNTNAKKSQHKVSKFTEHVNSKKSQI